MKNQTRMLLALLSLALVVTNNSATALIYQGLTNTSHGAATLSVTSNQLTVGNLGTNGQDGVDIALNPWNSFDGEWLDLDPSDALPVGASVQSGIIGTAGSVTNGLLGSSYCTKAGTSNYVISADFTPLGSSNRTVQVWNGTNLVAQVTGQSGPIVATSVIFVRSVSWHRIWTWWDWFHWYWVWDWDFHVVVNIAISGGPAVMGDRVLIIPEGAAQASSDSAGQILAANIPSITITNESVSVTYAGLTHTALGDATLSVGNLGTNGQDGVLEVGNLGTNGQDGVSIALNPGNDLDMVINDLDPSNALPVGAYVQSQMIGTAGTITNGLLGSSYCTKAGTSNYVISADFTPLGSSNRTVQVWNGPNLVAQVTGQSGPIVATSVIFVRSVSWHRILICACPRWWCPCWYVWVPTWDWDFHVVVNIAISGGPTVMGDRVLIIPEGAATASSQSAGRIRAAFIPSITITQEDVSFTGGLTHTALGAATTLSVTSNQLTVGNLGTNGQDGVSVALTVGNLGTNGQDGVYSFDGEWLDLDPSDALPVGASVQIQMIGTAGSVTTGFIVASSLCTKAGTSNYVISADFTPLGSSNRTVQVWNGSNLVGQVTGQSGPTVASFNRFPRTWSWHKRKARLGPFVIWYVYLDWDWVGIIPVTISGGPTVSGDRVLIIPEGATGASSVSAGQILAAYIPSITITNESVSFAPTLVITSIARTNNNIVLTWTTEGVSNIVQATTNATANYNTNNFVDVTNLVITTTTTNYVDFGGATNRPTRYYRIRESIQ